MVSRIATSSQNAATLRSLQEANEGMALSTYQITTGLKSRTLSDDAGNANQILTLKDVQTRTTAYMSNLTSANNQLTATSNTLNQMTDLITSAISLATTGRNENSASVRASLAPNAEALAQSFYSLLNTQFNGQYLFSGSNADVPPISGNAAPVAYPGTPASTWYQGDDSLPTAVSGSDTTLSYGVLGNSDAFTQLKSGLESLWYGLQNNDPTQMDSAIATLNTAKSALSAQVSNVGGQVDNIQQLTDRYTSQQTTIKGSLDDLQNVDISTALTTFSQQQATLQASMLVITQMNQVSLLDYLK